MEAMADAQLDLGCEADEQWVTITVRDHGPGIPDDELIRVFDPFYTSKPVGKGTGLGLYISYGMAADLGGELDAANHPAGGAIFTLKLPREGVAHEKS
jgi:two-component system sensor histidine kinase HupT/HoxJ